VGSVQQDLSRIADPDIQASLPLVSAARGDIEGADPDATRTHDRPAHGSLARFIVLRPHAEGGLGKVSVAPDRELNRRVAFKQIKSGATVRDPISRARFVAEAEITGKLEHPGIVPIYSLGHDPAGQPYYATRFVEGDNLQAAIERFHSPDDPGGRHHQLLGRLRRFLDVCSAS
jgi:serine/threonine protein kinase